MCDINKLTTAQIVDSYIKLRDQKKVIEARQKEELKPYNDALAMLEARALELLNSNGVESMKTPAGTVYASTRTSATVADRSAFMDYIEENHAFELLDVRANKTAVEEYLAEHHDLPPGVATKSVVTANFRRA